jgi:hypothetical protein
MGHPIKVAMGALLVAALPASAAIGHRLDPQERMAKALEGRIAGKPVDCLNLRDIRDSEIINKTGILYRTAGGAIYLNTPKAGAESLSDWDVMVTDTHSSQLCSIDTVKMYDRTAKMLTGVVFLGDFVPYRKPRAE